MTSSNMIRTLFAAVLLLCLLAAPVAAQDAAPTDVPTSATQAPIPTDAPVVIEEPAAPVSDLDRLYEFAENVLKIAIALIVGNGIVLTGGALAFLRQAIAALKFITSLTPSKRDDEWAKSLGDAVDSRYPTPEQTNALIDRRLTPHRAAPVEPVEPHHDAGRGGI